MKTKNTQKIIKIVIITIIIIIPVIAWVLWSSYQRGVKKSNVKLPSCLDCNVILISLDTLRAKSLPCFGYDKNTAPFLCDFANKSITFTNAFSQSSHTIDSHMSLFTSLYPTSHGVARPDFKKSLSNNVMTLAEILKKQHYSTYYFGHTLENDIQGMIFRGLDRGFDTIDLADDPSSWIQSLQKLKLSSQRKFFAFFHTYQVHIQYVPKPTSLGKIKGLNYYLESVIAYEKWYKECKSVYDRIKLIHPNIFPNRIRDAEYNYCDEIVEFYLRQGVNGETGNWGENEQLQDDFISSYFKENQLGTASNGAEKRQSLYEAKIYDLDSLIETFFSFLKQEKLLDNTIVIIFGDHGEEFQEHGHYFHYHYIYNETTHVPLILNIPNSPPKRIDKLAQLIDVLPTLLPILGITVPVQAQGINLLSDTTNDYVFSEVSIDRKRAIRGHDWELIVNYDREKGTKTRELYDLKADPGETVNLVQNNTLKASELEKILDDRVSRRKIYTPISQDLQPNISEEERRKLLQTGYR